MRVLSAVQAAFLCVVFFVPGPGLALTGQLNASALSGADTARAQETAGVGTVVVFGGDRNYPPFEWVADSGEIKGFITDIERALANRGDRRAAHVTGTWPGLVSALDDGSIDILPMFISPDREARYAFSQPFFFFKHAIFARPGLRGLTGVDDLSGMRVAVEERSFSEERLMAEHPDVKLIRVGDTLDTLQAVVNHRADAAIIAVPVAKDLIRTHRLRIERYGMPFWSEGYAFAVRKDRTALAEWMTQSLEKLLAGGDYDAIFGRWKGELEPYPVSSATDAGFKAPYIALGTGLLLLVAAGVFGWRYRVLEQRPNRNEEAHLEAESLIAHHDSKTGLPRFDLFSQQVEDSLRRAGSNRDRWKYALFQLTAYEGIIRVHGARVAVALASAFANRLREQNYRAIGYFGRGYFGVLSERPLFGLGPHVLLDPVDVPSEDAISAVMCGVARIPVDRDRLEDFAHFAETALSQCAARHRNWLLYESAMEADPVDPRIVRAFRQGETDGLSVVYQPQMDVASGAIIGVESLIRWQHPTLGLVPPGKFIPLLEQAGLVGKITDFMLSSATSLGARMALEERGVAVSINLSVYDLMDLGIYDRIAARLDWCNCPPGQFVVELTETAFVEDPELVRSTLMRLRSLGVKISIDDFGTGYASLSYLSEFPADEVKIDRLFVSRMRHSARDRAIIRSTIQLAHEIGLIVVAEGVEDQTVLAMLREEGCDRVQGYGISRPLEEDKLNAFLAKQVVQF